MPLVALAFRTMGLILLLAASAGIVVAILAAATVVESLRPRRRATGWAIGVGWPADPDAVGVPFEEWTLERPGGVRLPVWDVEGSDPAAPVLVLVHGFGRSRLTWLPHLEEWRSRSSRVVMIDLRGHGEATPDGAGLGDADVADVDALVEAVEGGCSSDRRPIVVVGRSLGATVGILAAAETSRIDGVIAVAPYETLAVPMRGRIRLRGLPDVPALAIALLVLRLLGRRPRSTVAAARRLSIPLLVVQGGRDQISPPADARAIAEAAADGRLELVDAAGHGDHWDIDPDRLNAAVEELLADVARTPAEA